MHYTGTDPFTKEQVHVVRTLKDRKTQRALVRFFRPENYFMAREVLLQAGRQDLIGQGRDCLIIGGVLIGFRWPQRSGRRPAQSGPAHRA
jgi:hypothetical protein